MLLSTTLLCLNTLLPLLSNTSALLLVPSGTRTLLHMLPGTWHLRPAPHAAWR